MTTPNPLSTGTSTQSTAAGFFRLLDLLAMTVGLASVVVAIGVRFLSWDFGFTAEAPAFIAIFCAGVSTIAALPAPGTRRRGAPTHPAGATDLGPALAPIPAPPAAPITARAPAHDRRSSN